MNKKLGLLILAGAIVSGTLGATLGSMDHPEEIVTKPLAKIVDTVDKSEGDNNKAPVIKKVSNSVTEVTKQEKQTNTKAENKKAAKANKKVNNKKSETKNSEEETKVTWQEEPDNSKYDKNGDYIYCFICGEPILGSSAEYGGEICHKECARKATENDNLIENYEKCHGNGDWEDADQWTSVHDWKREKAQNIDEN